MARRTDERRLRARQRERREWARTFVREVAHDCGGDPTRTLGMLRFVLHGRLAGAPDSTYHLMRGRWQRHLAWHPEHNPVCNPEMVAAVWAEAFALFADRRAA